METVLAVDLGGTKTAVGLVRADGLILAKESAPTPRGDPGAAVRLAAELADKARAKPAAGNAPTPRALGLALPGVMDASGRILVRSPSSGWSDVRFVDMFERAFGLPARAANDVRASAAAEARFGAGAALRSFIWITVSTGVGGAIWLDGKALGGASGMAGEIGHLVVRPGGARCACGNLGCLEAEASGSAWPRLLAMARAESARSAQDDGGRDGLGSARPRGAAAEPGPGEPLDAKSIAEGARRGEPDCLRAVYWASEALARGIGAAASLLDPEAVFLGGGVAEASDLLIPRIEALLPRLALSWERRPTKLMKTALGYDAALLGAASLALGPR